MVDGLFGWVDLMSADVGAAKAFYGGLFGWDLEDVPTDLGPSYTMCRLDGRLVAGIGPLPPDMAAAGAPSVWSSYVLVPDVDATCAAAEAAGGAVAMPAMDVMTEGRMAFVVDPSGASIGLWQPGDHGGAEVFNVPGAHTWNELQSRELEAALPFYEQVFGWRFGAGHESGYRLILLDAKEGDDPTNGGAMAMPPGVPAETPSFWAVYFAVADVEASVATVEQLGGTVLMPPMTMGPGTFAVCSDPTGAVFFVSTFPTG